MPYFHCSKCHHEWEGPEEETTCDWCQADNTRILEEQTPLEKMLNNYGEEIQEIFEKLDKGRLRESG